MTRLCETTYRCLNADCGHEFQAGEGPTTCPACRGLYVGRLSWYVVQCSPRAEAVVADRLRAAGHLCVFLHYLIAVKRTNRVTLGRRHSEGSEAERVKRPVMPGYVFAGLVPPVDFYGLSKTPGVAVVLRNERGGPAEVDAREIGRLRSWGDTDGQVAIEEPDTGRRALLQLGSVVRIKTGPFQGFHGPVIRDDGKLVRVEAQIFGRESPVDLPYGDVEVIAEAA